MKSPWVFIIFEKSRFFIFQKIYCDQLSYDFPFTSHCDLAVQRQGQRWRQLIGLEQRRSVFITTLCCEWFSWVDYSWGRQAPADPTAYPSNSRLPSKLALWQKCLNFRGMPPCLIRSSWWEWIVVFKREDRYHLRFELYQAFGPRTSMDRMRSCFTLKWVL